MLEKFRETREFVFDLHLTYLSDLEPEFHDVETKLAFSIVNPPTSPKVFMDTFKVVYDNDWAGDKPGFIRELGGSGFTVSDTYGLKSWFANEDEVERLNRALGQEAKVWYYFSRILIEVDSEFEWDFDDDEGMANYDAAAKDPIFASFTLDTSGVMGTSYILNPYEFN